jgi:hypothetical protein
MPTILAYVADNDSNDLLVTTLQKDTNTSVGPFNAPLQVTGPQKSKFAPAIAVLNTFSDEASPAVLVYVANDSADLLVTTSNDIGKTWTPSNPVTGKRSQSPPALCWLGGETLGLACVADNPSNTA